MFVKLVVVFGVFLLALNFIPVSRNFSDGKSNVKGITTDPMDVRIATDGGQTALVNKKVGALTKFPLSINPKTNELTVTTPTGVKTITALPQKAVDNMLASGVMTYVTGEKVTNGLASIENLIKLEEDNGILLYKVTGVRIHKLLGIIPIKTNVEADISADNGQVTKVNESLLSKILNKIAP